MKRITKDRTERRGELIETAKRLFLEGGYDQTAVSDIVKEIGVAQGTFYYHFKSKTDILKAVVERINGSLEKDIHHILARESNDPAKQLNDIINALFKMVRTNKELIDVIHKENNVVLHSKVMQMLVATLLSPMAEVLAKGASQGRFIVVYEIETAEALIGALIQMTHQADAALTAQRRGKIRTTLEHVFVKVLRIEDYTFRFKM